MNCVKNQTNFSSIKLKSTALKCDLSFKIFNMITRIWHGRTTAKNADIYLEYIQETGLKDYLATVGNISAKILRKIDGEICHFYTITEWKDIESIINFAGNKYEKARYYPEDKEYLLELEGVVNHYETFY